MSKQINVEEILNKYQKVFFEDAPHSTGVALEIDNVKSAIKEIVEAVIDECKDSVKLTDFAQEFMQEGVSEAIDKESILRVKKQVKYE